MQWIGRLFHPDPTGDDSKLGVSQERVKLKIQIQNSISESLNHLPSPSIHALILFYAIKLALQLMKNIKSSLLPIYITKTPLNFKKTIPDLFWEISDVSIWLLTDPLWKTI